MKTTEQLLADRFKVIAPYPGMKSHDWKVGDILDRNWCKYQNDDEDAGAIEWQLSDFPHLFQPLPWHKERSPEDMPEYVKHVNGGVFKVAEHCVGGASLEGNYYAVYINLQPATLAEYEAYQQRKNTP